METPEFSEHGAAPVAPPDAAPHGGTFPVQIDGSEVLLHTQFVSGEALLAGVEKRSCAYALIQLLPHDATQVIPPDTIVDLGHPGAHRFVTQRKQLVDIYINQTDHPKPYEIQPGTHTVADILGLAGQTADGYDLFLESDGALLPLSASTPVTIAGCEVFHSQVRGGGSS